MASLEQSMCTTAGYDDGLRDYDDCLDMIDNIFNFSVESLDGDDLTEDWASDPSKFGPIPLEVFPEVMPPVGIGGGGGFAHPVTECGGAKIETSEAEFKPLIYQEVTKPQLKPPTFSQEKKAYQTPKSFEAPSPDSVLERRPSSSTEKIVSFGIGTGTAIPVRTRTKRSHPRSGSGLTATPWSKSLQLFPIQTVRKKRGRQRHPQNDANEVKKCSHCEITKTPQWREGPMGPKTLCNACGVRYRSGRLFPEYRPAASPTFVPSLHSNSHRKVVEMRQKGAGMHSYVVKKPIDRLNCANSTLGFVHE